MLTCPRFSLQPLPPPPMYSLLIFYPHNTRVNNMHHTHTQLTPPNYMQLHITHTPYTLIHTHIHTYMHTHMQHTHTYTCTHTHTHTHTYTHTTDHVSACGYTGSLFTYQCNDGTFCSELKEGGKMERGRKQ